jgi:hypothetical protein
MNTWIRPGRLKIVEKQLLDQRTTLAVIAVDDAELLILSGAHGFVVHNLGKTNYCLSCRRKLASNHDATFLDANLSAHESELMRPLYCPGCKPQLA